MISRRSFFQHASLLAALPSASILLAAELARTPRTTEGQNSPAEQRYASGSIGWLGRGTPPDSTDGPSIGLRPIAG